MMYEYNFVKIELNVWGGKPKEDYQDIFINMHPKDGDLSKYSLPQLKDTVPQHILN